MSQELQHFKDLKLAKVWIQEKEHSQKNIEEHRSKPDKMYQMQSETLITKEKNAIERPQKQQENLRDQRNKSLEQDLWRWELAVKSIEGTYEQKLKNELCRCQLELQEGYCKGTEKITVNEKVIEAEDIADYASLKREITELQAEINTLRKQLDEAENQKLCETLNQPTAAHLALQAELKKTEYPRKLAQGEYQNHKWIPEQQLQNEVEHYSKVRRQLLKYEDQTRRLNGQVNNLKLQLRQT
ncbi:hypothetical protein scyTo_0010771 [Scyliorhinus torazame]|uniref:Uncharacterized protein n=1 Tax=Scyliorhinus torazame TaxID=75743 RepID=A0A401PB77_SCYTO|nr:hypothetical protein [Scyliorhinus torazame]